MAFKNVWLNEDTKIWVREQGTKEIDEPQFIVGLGDARITLASLFHPSAAADEPAVLTLWVSAFIDYLEERGLKDRAPNTALFRDVVEGVEYAFQLSRQKTRIEIKTGGVRVKKDPAFQHGMRLAAVPNTNPPFDFPEPAFLEFQPGGVGMARMLARKQT